MRAVWHTASHVVMPPMATLLGYGEFFCFTAGSFSSGYDTYLKQNLHCKLTDSMDQLQKRIIWTLTEEVICPVYCRRGILIILIITHVVYFVNHLKTQMFPSPQHFLSLHMSHAHTHTLKSEYPLFVFHRGYPWTWSHVNLKQYYHAMT